MPFECLIAALPFENVWMLLHNPADTTQHNIMINERTKVHECPFLPAAAIEMYSFQEQIKKRDISLEINDDLPHRIHSNPSV